MFNARGADMWRSTWERNLFFDRLKDWVLAVGGAVMYLLVAAALVKYLWN
jgi:hypothetical protein